MPDIHIPATRGRRAVERLQELAAAADRTVHGGLAGSVSVAAGAVLLSAADIGLQYVVGAFIIVFARRLASKKLSRDVVIPAPEPRRKFADMFPAPPGPVEQALDEMANR